MSWSPLLSPFLWAFSHYLEITDLFCYWDGSQKCGTGRLSPSNYQPPCGYPLTAFASSDSSTSWPLFTSCVRQSVAGFCMLVFNILKLLIYKTAKQHKIDSKILHQIPIIFILILKWACFLLSHLCLWNMSGFRFNSSLNLIFEKNRMFLYAWKKIIEFLCCTRGGENYLYCFLHF